MGGANIEKTTPKNSNVRHDIVEQVLEQFPQLDLDAMIRQYLKLKGGDITMHPEKVRRHRAPKKRL